MTPTWLYHRTEPATIVRTAEQLAQLLADGWADSPAAFHDIPTTTKTTRRKAKETTA